MQSKRCTGTHYQPSKHLATNLIRQIDTQCVYIFHLLLNASSFWSYTQNKTTKIDVKKNKIAIQCRKPYCLLQGASLQYDFYIGAMSRNFTVALSLNQRESDSFVSVNGRPLFDCRKYILIESSSIIVHHLSFC